MTQPQRFLMTADKARQVAESIASLSGVHSLSSGRFGEVALLFAGQRVAGLKFLSPKDDTQLAAHIVVDYAAAPHLDALAQDIRQAALAACPELNRIDVVFADAA